MNSRLLRIHTILQQFVVRVLLALLMTVVLYATVQLTSAIAWTLAVQVYNSLFRTDLVQLEAGIKVLHEVFSSFLLILIGVELMETVRMYLDDHLIHIEVVLTVAIIAISREAIDIDFSTAQPVEILGTAFLLLALTIGYYLYKKASRLTEDRNERAEAALSQKRDSAFYSRGA